MPAVQFMSIPEQTGSAAGTAAVDVKSLKMQGLYTSFSNYMQQNSSNTAQAALQQNQGTDAQRPVQAQETNSLVQQQYEKQQGQSAVQADKVNSAAEDAGTMDEAARNAVEEAVKEITEAIKENLGVDDEQIEAALEVLGLTQTDLLNTQNLVAVSVELTGSEDAGMMLFNENFQGLMQEAAAITDDLLKDLGLTVDELMGQLQESADNIVENSQDVQIMPEETDSAIPKEVQTAPQDGSIQQETSVQQAETVSAGPQEISAKQPEAVQMTQEADAQSSQETGVSSQAAEVQEQPAEKTMQQETEQNVQPQTGQNAQQETETAAPVQTQEQPKEQSAQQNQENAQTHSDRETSQKREVREPEADPAASRNTQDAPRFDFHSQIQQPAAAAPLPQNVSAQAPMPQVYMQDVIQQIVEYTRVNITENVKSIEMQLNPENLGKIYLHVSEKQGTITAQLTAQNENMKEALIQQASILKESLNQQGIKVDAVEVSTGTHEFENNLERDAHSQEEQARQQEEQNERRSRRSINLNDFDDSGSLSGLMSEEEALVAQIMRDNGNNVDYKA